MVKNSPKNKYLRRYRTCFIIGLVILSFQILLVANFLTQNKSADGTVGQWEPSNPETDNEVKSALNEETVRRLTGNITQDIEFDLPCHINGKEALSAINRAKAQKCKQLIANITCLSQSNKLYPTELKPSCPAGTFERGKELGCFKDEKNFRLLNGYFGVNKLDNSPEYCMKLCLQSGFPYAGVEYGEECFCGIDEPALSSKVQDSSCNMKCPGDSHSMCGGYYTINIYQTGIKRFVAQSANDSQTEVKKAKIVFLLTLNGRALRQVKRLIKLLYHKDHYYYIHVDVRQDYLFRELLSLERFPNIRLTRTRFATIWGGSSLLEMLRSCMNELLQIPSWNWEFVLNLSESDYPVKTVSKLTAFLSRNRNRNFVKSHGREVQRFIQKQGLDKTFVECETRMWRVGNRKLPMGIQIDGGSDWIALSRKFVEYVADSNPDDLVSGLLRIFKHTLLPAESFFHTVLRNSKFCGTYIDNNLHVTNWKRKLGCKCQYKHVVDWCGCSPNDFRPEDWTKVLNTLPRPIYFARKFEPIINQAVILQLELWLFDLEKPSRQIPNLDSYWENLYHEKDLGVEFDDAIMTLANSISRLASNSLLNFTRCNNITLENLSQVHSFHKNDHYQYTLFLFNTSSLCGRFEVAVKPLNKLVTKNNSPSVNLSVSTKYDQKEQLSRNFLRLISPYSEPVLTYNFDTFKTPKQYNLTCLWIDPIGNLRDVSGFYADDASLTGYVKLNVKQPHLPGIWQAKVLHKTSLIAEVSFLVLPLQYLYGNLMVEPQITFLHNGLVYGSTFSDNYSQFLPNISQREALERNALKNFQRFNESLLEWVDALVASFYSLEKMCVENGDTTVSCEKTSWSSFAPDPKGAIEQVNRTTGAFDIW